MPSAYSADGIHAILVRNQRNNDLRSFFNRDCAGVDADIVVISGTPGASGLVLIIDFTALIIFLEAGVRALLGLAIETDDAVSTVVHIRMDERMEAIFTIF